MFDKGVAQHLPFLDQTSSSASSGYEESSADSTSLGSLIRNRIVVIEAKSELVVCDAEPHRIDSTLA